MKHNQVDDTPYGGGDGMLLKPEPIFAAVEFAKEKCPDAKVVLSTPKGKIWDQARAKKFAESGENYIFICPHYEGYDERILTLVDYQFSLGKFILTGGEIPTMAVVDSIVRLIPGVLGGGKSAEIESLLETDLYKFSMGQAIYHQFSDYKTTWSFKCRNEDVVFTPEMVEEIKDQIQAYCTLRFTEDELAYLENIKWIKGSYVDFLRLWEPRYEDFTITTEGDKGLTIETKGTWLNTSMYEIPTLAIVNEVYFRMAYDYSELHESFKERLEAKIQTLISGENRIGNFSEFGVRRRLSSEAQDLAVRRLAEENSIIRVVRGEEIGTTVKNEF